MSSQPLRRPFVEHLGGSVLRHCPMPSIDPTSASGRRWTAAQSTPSGYQTAGMSELSAELVETAWSSYFTWAQQEVGRVRGEALPAAWQDYSSGINPTLSHLCMDAEGQIVSFAFVSPEVWDGRTFVVAETVNRNQPLGLTLLKTTVAASLRGLDDLGVQRVELEGHSTDPHIPRLFDTLPPGPSDPLDICILGSSGSSA